MRSTWRIAGVGWLLGAALAGCGSEERGGGSHGNASAASTGAGGTCATDADCDDGLYCSGEQACVDGACVGTPVDCGAPPAGCAAVACDEAARACVPVPFDGDGDGHGKPGCTGGSVPDDDCDDGDASKYPGNWDGPKGDGHADACNAVDEDCNGTPDDGALADNSTCTCSNGATKPCGPCSDGTSTCDGDTWGPCEGGTTNLGQSCGPCGATIACGNVCQGGTPDFGKPCGSCGGTIACGGTCSVLDPPNLGQACSNCGGSVGCDGQCSVGNANNSGDACPAPNGCTGTDDCNNVCSSYPQQCPPGWNGPQAPPGPVNKENAPDKSWPPSMCTWEVDDAGCGWGQGSAGNGQIVCDKSTPDPGYGQWVYVEVHLSQTGCCASDGGNSNDIWCDGAYDVHLQNVDFANQHTIGLECFPNSGIHMKKVSGGDNCCCGCSRYIDWVKYYNLGDVQHCAY